MKVAVIAANNQSTAGIERNVSENNPNVLVYGLGALASATSLPIIDPADVMYQNLLEQSAGA